MRVLITDSGAVRVEDPNVFDMLALETRVPLHRTVAALQSSGLALGIENGHAWLSIAALKRAAATGEDEWAERFDHMIDAVRRYGWVSEDGQHVRAHVEGG